MTLKKGTALAVVVLTLMTAGLGIGYGLWAKILSIEGSVAIGYTNADFVAAETNDPPDTIDPGYDKDVADCTATVVSAGEVAVVIAGAYPSYTCVFTTTIQNNGSLPERREALEFDVPPVLTVKELNDLTGVVLDPGEQDVEEFVVHVEQEAAQGATYGFTIRKPFSLFVAGTMGFWKNWDRHNTFTQSQIEGWLAEIDASSAWLGPSSINGMEEVFAAAAGQSATPKSRFLAHYLATRLNERSGILVATRTHNVTGQDPGNYLGLSNPSSATLAQIIAAIEAKFGTLPTKNKFNIMKDVCDALNNLDI